MSEGATLEPEEGEAIAVALRVADPILFDCLSGLLLGSRDIVLTRFADEADVVVTDSYSPADEPSVVAGEMARLREAARQGATRGVLLPASRAELRVAIGAAHHGFLCLPRSLAPALVMPDSLDGAAPGAAFTARERQVLRLLADGASNKAIARELRISVHTAKFHVAAAIAKIGASGRTDAVARAIRLGVVHI